MTDYLALARRVSLDYGCEKSEISEKSPEPEKGMPASGWAPHPTLPGGRVYRAPVDASQPPANWNGVAPASCGAPNACRVLGPCQCFAETGHCWKEPQP